jgi:competence protein ComEC
VLYKTKPNNPNQSILITANIRKTNAQLYADMDQISISTTFKKDSIMPPITNNDYSKLRRTISTKELNVAVALILGQNKIFHPIFLQDYQYAGAIHILSVLDYMLIPFAVFDFILKPIPNTKSCSLQVNSDSVIFSRFALIAGP